MFRFNAIIATAIGPSQNLVTRRKARMAGIWVNAESRTFMGVPSYLAVLSTRPFEKRTPFRKKNV